MVDSGAEVAAACKVDVARQEELALGVYTAASPCAQQDVVAEVVGLLA